MRFTGARVALAALAALTACGGETNFAPTAPRPNAPNFIVNGTYTGANYGSVGALLFDYDRNGVINGDDLFCTGSLISPTVFLTAAHCVVSSDTPVGSQFYVSFAPDLYAKNIKVIKATGYASDP